MAHVVKDRVQETSTTTGTGTLTLGGAVTGFQTFSSAIGNTNTTYYAIQNGSEWEVGIGTVGAGTLSRDTILESSNAGSAVNLSAGTKYVFCTYPAEKSVDLDTAQTLTNKTISGSSNTLSNIGNSQLTNSSITVNGTAISLGGSATITAVNPNALTIGTGLSGTSYNGSAAVTIAIDSTVATLTGTQTLTNKTLTSPTLTTPVLGTPTSGTLTNCTGLPISTGVSGLGTGVATFLATPSSANLAAAVTGETGTGALVFGTSPTLVEPVITGTITEDVFALSDAATITVDPANGSIQYVTLAGTARTLSFTNMIDGEAITLMINDGTAGTITTWNATFVNNGGAAPTLSTTGFTVVSVWRVNSVVYAAVVGNA